MNGEICFYAKNIHLDFDEIRSFSADFLVLKCAWIPPQDNTTRNISKINLQFVEIQMIEEATIYKVWLRRFTNEIFDGKWGVEI